MRCCDCAGSAASSATTPQQTREADGRYVLVIELSSGRLWSLAEWPAALHQVAAWTDKTVLAGDDDDDEGTATTLLALTPTDDG